MKDTRRTSMKYFPFYVILLGSWLVSSTVNSHFLDRTTFVIMSQDAHEKTAEDSKQELRHVLGKIGVKEPNVVLLHKDLPSHGGWTIFPLLDPLLEDYHDLIDWYVFLDEQSTIDPDIFMGALKKHNHRDYVFLGKALQDQESVIIHHYDQDFNFKYPDFSAGFVLSAILVKTMAKELKASNFDLKGFPKDFSIGMPF